MHRRLPPPPPIITLREKHYLPFENSSIEGVRLHRYGVAFSIPTYTESLLQEMHISFMEELLLQAVGRARLVTNKRKVVVFSKLPLAQSLKLVDNDYAEILDKLFKADVTGSSNIAFNEIITPPIYQYPIFTSIESQTGLAVIQEYINDVTYINNKSNDDSIYFKVSKQTKF